MTSLTDVRKYLTKATWGRKGMFGSQLEGSVHHGRPVRSVSPSHVASTVRKWWETYARVQLTSLLFIQSRTPAHPGRVLAALRVACPRLIKPLWEFPHTHTKKCISGVILHWVEVAVKIYSHRTVLDKIMWTSLWIPKFHPSGKHAQSFAIVGRWEELGGVCCVLLYWEMSKTVSWVPWVWHLQQWCPMEVVSKWCRL